jgi:hypothetical protein
MRVPFEFQRHAGRRVFQYCDGEFVLGVWSQIAAKVSLLGIFLDRSLTPRQDHTFKCNESQRASYAQAFPSPQPYLGSFSVSLLAHTGDGTAPYYAANDTGRRIYGIRYDLR